LGVEVEVGVVEDPEEGGGTMREDRLPSPEGSQPHAGQFGPREPSSMHHSLPYRWSPRVPDESPRKRRGSTGIAESRGSGYGPCTVLLHTSLREE